MDRNIYGVIVSLLLLVATPAFADKSFMVSPSVGNASINNISGYKNAYIARVDAAFFPIPEFGVGVFALASSEFRSSGGQDVFVKVTGPGLGVTGRWPAHPHMQPYARADYLFWTAEANGLGRALGKESGGSAGLALGVQFPIKRFLGIKTEVSGYNKVSGAQIRQFSVGLTFEF